MTTIRLRGRGWGWLGASLLAITTGCSPAPQTSNTPAAGAALPAAIVDPYLAIQEGLAHDSVDNLRANAGNIATAATALGAPAMKIDTAAVQLASAGDLADARQKFGTLSEAIVAYKDGLHLKAGEGVKQAFCPMAVKPWLQRGDTISNPYYGTQMPTCGSFTQ
jgi:membrane fusion protein, copper/silver efflux system